MLPSGHFDSVHLEKQMDTSGPAVIDAISSRKALPTAKRQYRSAELKRQIVEETMAPGASVARVARAHGVNANQVFAWRRQYQRGLLKPRNRALSGLLAVRLAEAGAESDRCADAAKPLRRDSGGTSQGTVATDGRGGSRSPAVGAERVAGMMGLAAGTRIWIVAGVTDMRRGFVGLSGMVQTALQENPFSGQVFIFRGRRGDLLKVLWWDGDGLCLFAKRLERGRFIWPQATGWRGGVDAGAAFHAAGRH